MAAWRQRRKEREQLAGSVLRRACDLFADLSYAGRAAQRECCRDNRSFIRHMARLAVAFLFELIGRPRAPIDGSPSGVVEFTCAKHPYRSRDDRVCNLAHVATRLGSGRIFLAYR